MKISLKYIYFLCSLVLITLSCSPEEAEVSKVQRFKSFGFEGINDRIEVQEPENATDVNTVIIPFTFNNDQIFDFHVDIHVDDNSTAVEDVDFALGSHTVDVPTLAKKGEIEFIIGGDVFLEGDESVFLTLTSDHASGLPVTKTIEVVIKNTGGCPAYVHNDFVGDYEVVSDEWVDYNPGTVVPVTNEGNNVLGFKYNCGADAKTILFTVNPDNFGISGAKQEYCTYSGTLYTADVVEASSIVNTCEKTLNVVMSHSDGGGSGNYGIVLKKK